MWIFSHVMQQSIWTQQIVEKVQNIFHDESRKDNSLSIYK